MDSDILHIYTDGACSGNPGRGGWGVYIEKGIEKIELNGSDEDTTNNRMELVAVIQALRYVDQNSKIKLFTDSKYVLCCAFEIRGKTHIKINILIQLQMKKLCHYFFD